MDNKNASTNLFIFDDDGIVRYCGVNNNEVILKIWVEDGDVKIDNRTECLNLLVVMISVVLVINHIDMCVSVLILIGLMD